MDIDHHIEGLINNLGLEPSLVRTVTIDHRTVTVEMFATNDDGAKFVRQDGNVATHTLTYPHQAFFKVTTQ